MNIDQMSERLQKILMDAINLAKSNQHPSVDTVDMLETIFKDDVLDGLFERIGLDKVRALQMVQKESNRVAKSSTSNINLSNAGAATESPSTADNTDIAGVIMPSPKNNEAPINPKAVIRIFVRLERPG